MKIKIGKYIHLNEDIRRALRLCRGQKYVVYQYLIGNEWYVQFTTPSSNVFNYRHTVNHTTRSQNKVVSLFEKFFPDNKKTKVNVVIVSKVEKIFKINIDFL